MTWYKIGISAQQVASNYHGEIQDQFEQIFIISQNREEMALFTSGVSTSDMLNIYFTPACAAHPQMKLLMDRYGANPCGEPTRKTESELGLLVGDQRRWKDFIWSTDLT
jgi:hypothetical protein